MASRFIAAQIVGGREKQEDDFAILDLGGHDRQSLVFVVADGMGGHSGASEAARLAVEGFCEGMRAGVGLISLRLSAALYRANDGIAAAGRLNSKVRGAGCTLVAAAIEDNLLSWISVGDSSLYLFRKGFIRRLNKLHRANSGGGQNAPYKYLRSSLNGSKIKDIDISQQPWELAPDDCVIVASDGLECINERRMTSILRRSARRRPSEIVERLLREVQSWPIAAQDNTTIIFYRHPGGRDTAKDGMRHSRLAWKVALISVVTAVLAFALFHGLLGEL